MEDTQERAPLVALYVHALYNGGIERVILNLAREFLARGLRVDLVVDRWQQQSPFASAVPRGTRLVDIDAPAIVQRPLKLARYLSRERPAALLSARHFGNELAPFARRLAGTNTRIVVSVHTTLTAEVAASPLTSSWRLVPHVARLAYRFADRIVAVSKGTGRDLARVLRVPEERVDVIYNPVLTPDIVEGGRAPVDHPWFQPGEPPVVLALGRIEPQKDFGTLIEAFAQVRREQRARLAIFGQGRLWSSLEQRIRELDLVESVKLGVFAANPFALMARAAVVVQPSVWEGLSSIPIEALALGVPVICTDCPHGPSEILNGGALGQLVPMRKPEELAHAIGRVLRGDVPRVDLGNALDRFRSDVVADQYLKVLGIDA